jgi:hypothetical protein
MKCFTTYVKDFELYSKTVGRHCMFLVKGYQIELCFLLSDFQLDGIYTHSAKYFISGDISSLGVTSGGT